MNSPILPDSWFIRKSPVNMLRPDAAAALLTAGWRLGADGCSKTILCPDLRRTMPEMAMAR